MKGMLGCVNDDDAGDQSRKKLGVVCECVTFIVVFGAPPLKVLLKRNLRCRTSPRPSERWSNEERAFSLFTWTASQTEVGGSPPGFQGSVCGSDMTPPPPRQNLYPAMKK